MIADYWLIRRTRLDVDASTGRRPYAYRGAGTRRPSSPSPPACSEPARLPQDGGAGSVRVDRAGWAAAYAYAWFIGLFVALTVYAGMMWRPKPGSETAAVAAQR
jgi:cytosine/uracil/thiamine/allantoin permease